MCHKSIDIITHQPADVTCGLCQNIDNCNLPPAVDRRRQTKNIDQQIIGKLSDPHIRHQLNLDTGSTRRRNPFS